MATIDHFIDGGEPHERAEAALLMAHDTISDSLASDDDRAAAHRLIHMGMDELVRRLTSQYDDERIEGSLSDEDAAVPASGDDRTVKNWVVVSEGRDRAGDNAPSSGVGAGAVHKVVELKTAEEILQATVHLPRNSKFKFFSAADILQATAYGPAGWRGKVERKGSAPIVVVSDEPEDTEHQYTVVRKNETQDGL